MDSKVRATDLNRFIFCPGSLVLENKKKYKDEGTLAHALANLYINYNLKKIPQEEFKELLKIIKNNKYFNENMNENIKKYSWWVLSYIREMCKITNKIKILTETKMNFTCTNVCINGKVDVAIITPKIIQVIDLKYGAGIEVEADNPQLKAYALGLIEQSGQTPDIIKLTVCQPRADNNKTLELKYEELLEWKEEILLPQLKKIKNGTYDCKMGAHCNYCPARTECRKRYNNLQELRQIRDMKLLTQEEKLEAIEKFKGMSKWVKELQEYVTQQALLSGHIPEGYELIADKSNRRIFDQEGAMNALKKAGFIDEEIMDNNIKGICKLEELLGYKNFNVILGPYIEKPTGKPKLRKKQSNN